MKPSLLRWAANLARVIAEEELRAATKAIGKRDEQKQHLAWAANLIRDAQAFDGAANISEIAGPEE